MSLSSEFLSRGRRSWLALLPVLLGVLAVTLLGTTAYASAPGVAENRVGAFNVAGGVVVEPPERVSAGQGRVAAEIRPGFVVATGVAANSARGISSLGGHIAEEGVNAAGGRLITSVGAISQKDFAPFVERAMIRGDSVEILTGAHGLPNGTMTGDASMLADDIAKFGHWPGVTIHNVMDMSPGEIRSVMNGPGTIIGGFCDSAACLGAFR